MDYVTANKIGELTNQIDRARTWLSYSKAVLPSLFTVVMMVTLTTMMCAVVALGVVDYYHNGSDTEVGYVSVLGVFGLFGAYVGTRDLIADRVKLLADITESTNKIRSLETERDEMLNDYYQNQTY